MRLKKIYDRIGKYFPLDPKDDLLPEYLKLGLTILADKAKAPDSPRLSGSTTKARFNLLARRYGVIPQTGKEPARILRAIINDLFSGIPVWRSPKLQYNVGTSVSTAAAAIYALALDKNIYAINSGLAGNTLAAETAVSNMLSGLSGAKSRSEGIFTFGGTATNLYAKKIGIAKSMPDASRKGLRGKAKAMVTRDAHFCHAVTADWLGIGRDNVVIIEPGFDRRSDLRDAEKKMRTILGSGGILTSISINGGTTYNHIIDDIAGFVKLRNKLAREYSLKYLPHIHVDSVIGWTWLFFRGYDFGKNPLGIGTETLGMIEEQYKRISSVWQADSWGVDFHKGVGGCPVHSSVFMLNNKADLAHISKNGSVPMHPLAEEYSFTSPVDYTLETSRSGGPALSALVSLQLLGLDGYRRNLADLTQQTCTMRRLLEQNEDIKVCHKESSLGFVTMLRLYPPGPAPAGPLGEELDAPSPLTLAVSKRVNAYMKEFFSWLENRRKAGEATEYSFSSGYITLPNGAELSSIKLYPVSPHFSPFYAEQAAKEIVAHKRFFDKHVYRAE